MQKTESDTFRSGREPKKLGPAILHGDISVETVGKEKIVFVGNSSLKFTFTDVGSGIRVLGDFSLGEKGTPVELPPLRALKMFCFGMIHLRNYLLTTDEVDISKLNPLNQNSNEDFMDFIWGFFKAGGHPEIATGSKETSRLVFDLKKFLELAEQDELIQRMKQFAKRAEGMRIQALVPITTS